MVLVGDDDIDWLVLEELIVGRAESRPVNDNDNANVGE